MSEHPYQRIARELGDDIRAGRLAPGQPLPSEPELAERYSVARMTIRRALDELRALGLVVSAQGRRTVVRQAHQVRLLQTGDNYRRRRAELPAAGVSNWSAEVAAQGGLPEQRLMEVARVQAPDEIAERLELSTGSLVVVRRRLFVVDGVPSQFSDGYYPLDLAAGTLLEVRAPISAHVVIEDHLGLRVARFIEDVSARLPTSTEARELHMRPRGPVVRMLRTAYAPDGRPLEVLDSLQPADRHTWRYVIDVPPPAVE